jgi:ribonuclease P/MRP protein subunit POP7
MAGKKRTVNGQVKPQTEPPQPTEDVTMAEPTPPCGQPQAPSSKTTDSQTTTESQKDIQKPASQAQEVQPIPKPVSKPHSTTRKKHQKMQKLPDSEYLSAPLST